MGTLKKYHIAVFASGNGTNFEALVEACRHGTIPADVRLLVCDKQDAYVLQRAARLGVEAVALQPRQFVDKAAYETRIVQLLQQHEIAFVCLAGYMRIVGPILLNAYAGRILNIHPALLPAFKGAHAIDDAFDFGVKVFGVTVHLIDHTIDGGVILAQRAFEYHGGDRDEVERRIHEIEHQLYPEAVAKYCQELERVHNPNQF